MEHVEPSIVRHFADWFGLPNTKAMSPRALNIASTIGRHVDEEWRCTLSVPEIAAEAGVSDRTVQRAFKDLRDTGWLWIRYVRTGPRSSAPSVYQILPTGRSAERERSLRALPQKDRSLYGDSAVTVFSPSSIAPSAVAAVGLSEGSADLAAVDDAAVSGEPAGLESGRSHEGGEGGSAAEPSLDDIFGIPTEEEPERNLPDGDGAPQALAAPQQAAQEQPRPRSCRPTGASPLATARAHTVARVAFALTCLFGDLGLDEKAMRSWSSQLWTLAQSRGLERVELLLLALSVVFNQRRKAMERGTENPWTKPAEEVRRYLYRTLTKMDLPTYATASALHWEGREDCPWKADHDAAVRRDESYGVAPPVSNIPWHDPFKRRPFREIFREVEPRAVDQTQTGAQVGSMPDPSPSPANECSRLILAAFAATYHGVRSLADLAEDVTLANRLAQRSESACAGGTLTTEDVIAVVRHFGTIQAFDQKRSGIAKAGSQLSSYLAKQLREAKRGCATVLTLQTNSAKYIEVKPKISTAQPGGGEHLNLPAKPDLTTDELAAFKERLKRFST